MMSIHQDLLIGGQFYGGPCDTSIGKGQSYSPYSGKLVGTFAEAGWPEMDAALDAAQSAFETWRKSPRRERQALLRRVAASIRDRRQELAELMADEIGKPITAALAEVDRTAITFDLSADLLTMPSGEILPCDFDARGDGYRCLVERFPIGAVFAVVPYNWPLNLAAHKIAPALAAGNTVLVKPATRSALTTLALIRLIHEAGCPDGVVNGLACDNRVAERGLTDERVAMLSFTGSVPVGWSLKEKLPDRRVTLELGGDATAVVMPDADLDWAVKRLVAGAFLYAGQICISIQHALIHVDVYDQVIEKLIAATEACPAGDPRDPDVVCGPVIDSDAIEKIESWISEAETAGAHVLAGGSRSGNVLMPTLIADVPASCQLANEEVFGPVLTVSRFESPTGAIAKINGSKYGIHAGIFTSNIATAEQFFQNLEVGGVIINDFPTLRFDNMPYGGVKRSGVGREGVVSAYMEMTEPKVMLTRLT